MGLPRILYCHAQFTVQGLIAKKFSQAKADQNNKKEILIATFLSEARLHPDINRIVKVHPQ